MNEPAPDQPPQHWLARLRRFRRQNAGTAVAVRELSLVTLIGIVIVGIAFLVAYRFVRPAPPSSFVISTGPQGGAYTLFGEKYRDLLAAEKIKVELRPSTGSPQNLKRIADPGSGVDVAFLQGGIADAEKEYGVVSLGAIYYEPLWIFYRAPTEYHRLGQLAGKRIAAGSEGSGTRALAMHVLEASGAVKPGAAMVNLGGNRAAQALIDGKLDAVLLVVAPDAPVLQKLFRTPGIRLMSLSHADALARRFPYLSPITLPRGMIDLGNDIPSANIQMVAATAHLVAREDFHPALVSVLLQAATRVHGGAGVFRKAGEFPAVREAEFPVSEDAQRFFKSGPPLLQRYLPFWLANLFERLLVLIVPLVAVLIPVTRFAPVVYDWRIKRKIFRWYRELRAVDVAMRAPGSTDTAPLLQRLDEIELGVNTTVVPLTYWDYVYTLRGHIDLVRARLSPGSTPPAAPAATPPVPPPPPG